MALTARQIAEKLGTSAQKVNVMLKELGYLSGSAGQYTLTEMGKKFGQSVVNDNGYGGYAHRGWEWVKWSKNIVPILQNFMKKG